jgi:hypothetical protein
MSSHYYHPVDRIIDRRLRAVRHAVVNGLGDPAMLRDLIEQALTAEEPRSWAIGADPGCPDAERTVVVIRKEPDGR